MMLLATALTALAFAALPAMASAGTPQIHCPGTSGTHCEFSGTTSSKVELTKTSTSLAVHCSQTTVSGTITTSEGTVRFQFHNCTDNLFGLPCTTSGQSSGTITTTLLPYDNIYTTDNNTSPGVLVTPATGSSHFASFTCANGANVVSGNGVIGSLSSPACGAESASLTLGFTASSKGHQTHKQITNTGTIYDLTSEGLTASQVGSGTVTIVGGGNFSVTCV